jgi:arylsulfatase A-like enzyme
MDREIGKLFNVLPANTLVVFMSDNGFLWGEPKSKYHALYTKQWPYNESIRVPIYMTSLDGSLIPKAKVNDIVLNVDLRTSLTHAVGITPITRTEGINLFSPFYIPRTAFPLEHLGVYPATYCGAREANFMYVRYQEKDGYKEELYNNPAELINLVGNPAYQADYIRLKSEAAKLCNPAPPGYRWQ